jgi:hypothetical protein
MASPKMQRWYIRMFAMASITLNLNGSFLSNGTVQMRALCSTAHRETYILVHFHTIHHENDDAIYAKHGQILKAKVTP